MDRRKAYFITARGADHGHVVWHDPDWRGAEWREALMSAWCTTDANTGYRLTDRGVCLQIPGYLTSPARVEFLKRIGAK